MKFKIFPGYPAKCMHKIYSMHCKYYISIIVEKEICEVCSEFQSYYTILYITIETIEMLDN